MTSFRLPATREAQPLSHAEMVLHSRRLLEARGLGVYPNVPGDEACMRVMSYPPPDVVCVDRLHGRLVFVLVVPQEERFDRLVSLMGNDKAALLARGGAAVFVLHTWSRKSDGKLRCDIAELRAEDFHTNDEAEGPDEQELSDLIDQGINEEEEE